MEEVIDKLELVKLWLFTKHIEDKGATATSEELLAYIEAHETLRDCEWDYNDCQATLSTIIDGLKMRI